MNFWQDLRRRHLFRLIGLYIVGAWLAIQVASTFFSAWGIPDTALRYLIVAAVLGFPIAVVFGWFFDITSDGIVRTRAASAMDTVDYGLKRTDYLILAALAVVFAAILYGSFERVRQEASGPIVARDIRPNSIAVLPFVNLNDDADTEYFSDGVTEEILHHLSALKAFHVLGRSSSFAFKDSDLAVPRISEILGVRYLLQGSVRRDRDEVRVTARLIDDSGYQVWSETFDRKLERIFSIQSDIANSVANQLFIEIAPRAGHAGSTTTNIDAYLEYLIGRDYLNKRPLHWQEKAAAAFQLAIDLDPEFAPPHAGLAIMLVYESLSDPVAFAGRIAEAQGIVDRALSLDPQLAEAHAAQGLLLQFGQDADLPAAEAALRRAIDLDPTLVIAYSWLNLAVRGQGRLAEAQSIKEEALRIDPLNPVVTMNIAWDFRAKGDFHRAEKLLLRLLDLPEPPGEVYPQLAALYRTFGRLVDENHWAKQAILVHEGSEYVDWRYAGLSIHYRSLGIHEEADYWLEKSVANRPDHMHALFLKCYSLKLQGKYDEMKHFADEFLRDNPVDESQLPVRAAWRLGAVKIITGDYTGGIALTEQAIDTDKPLSMESGGMYEVVDGLHGLAFAYRQTNQPVKSDRLLEKVRGHLQSWIGQDDGGNSQFFELQALNSSMRGDIDGAISAFESAVDVGWRNYYYVVNDRRWGDVLERPAMKSLLAFVKADLDRQRRRIEAIDAEENFRAVVEQHAVGQSGR